MNIKQSRSYYRISKSIHKIRLISGNEIWNAHGRMKRKQRNNINYKKLYAPNAIKYESCQVRLPTNDLKSIYTSRNLLVALETICKAVLQFLIVFSDTRRWLPSDNKEQNISIRQG